MQSNEYQPDRLEARRGRKTKTAVFLASLILAGGIITYTLNRYSSPSLSISPSMTSTSGPYGLYLQQVGNSLINLHQDSDGGWRFQSQIQSPHYQTDRDVGAAGIGMAFLSLADSYPNQPKWINAAEQTANWLEAVSARNGSDERYWYDYVDDGQRSSDVYTSFDDGTIGISDFFWNLYEQTKNPSYQQMSLDGLRWTLSQAETISKGNVAAYRWKWDVTDPNSDYYMGMGEGQEGIIYALTAFYQRLKATNPSLAGECQKYITGGLAYIDMVQQNLAVDIGNTPTIPETGVAGENGDTALDSGYLSGAAGGAYMYLKLYQVFGGQSYLNKAEALLGWLSDSQNGPLVEAGDNAVTWKLMLDQQGGDDNQYATGVEEGSAGIGWTFLQAYKQTANKTYLSMAEQAGNWLSDVAINDGKGGLAWHEDEHPVNDLLHANLDNGDAGIGIFLHDLFLATGISRYEAEAKGALQWIRNGQRGSGNQLSWNDNGGNDPYSNDPSWHWGDAGIIDFIQRLNNGPLDMPGEEPALPTTIFKPI